jgi:hypothetical protein
MSFRPTASIKNIMMEGIIYEENMAKLWMSNSCC